MKSFHTSVTDLRQDFANDFTTFPYECGWADEAIYFITAEQSTPQSSRIQLALQISADGIRWLDEGTTIELAGPGEAFTRVSEFGGFLRLRGTVEGPEPRCTLTVRLALKG